MEDKVNLGLYLVQVLGQRLIGRDFHTVQAVRKSLKCHEPTFMPFLLFLSLCKQRNKKEKCHER